MQCIFATIMLATFTAIAAEPGRRAPDTRPDTTLPATEGSLLPDIAAAVERAQQIIRGQRAATRPTTQAARNTLETEEIKASTYDPLREIAKGVIGREGTIAIHGLDVLRTKSAPIFAGEPTQLVQELQDDYPYLIVGEIPATASTYVTPSSLEYVRKLKQVVPHVPDQVRGRAERARPKHQLFVVSNDPDVKSWVRGSTRAVSGEIAFFHLEQVAGDYVRAVIVLKMTALRATTQPAK